jgi:phosphate transport system permease protein
MTDRGKNLARRYARQKRLMVAGWAAIALALGMLVWLLGQTVVRALPALFQTEIALEIAIDPNIDPETLIKQAVMAQFPDVTDRLAKRRLARTISPGAAAELAQDIKKHPAWHGMTRRVWVAAAASDPETLSEWAARGEMRRVINTRLFTHADSRDAEMAGILGALAGSVMSMVVCLGLALPIGVAAAIYLQELAPRHRLTDLIEISINNLAAVPSIVFGLLGLVVFLQMGGVPRSASLAGGMTLAMMSFPTIIIAARAALGAVPPSIRQAAQGLGAGPVQVVFHHVLPLATPGIWTGAVLAMARALGETAPLLMIGMVAFIADVPGSFTQPATVLPVQIFLWADHPDPAFAARTAAAIIVLLLVLLVMNAAAIVLRHRSQKTW